MASRHTQSSRSVRRSKRTLFRKSLLVLTLLVASDQASAQTTRSPTATADSEPPKLANYYDPKTDLWEIAFHGAAIMDNFWRIQNGYAGYYNGSHTAKTSNVYFREIDLSNPFNLGSLEEAPLSLRNVGDYANANVGTRWLGANWGYKNKFYSIGGNTPDVPGEGEARDWPGFHTPVTKNEISVYDSGSDQWGKLFPRDQEHVDIERAGGMFTVEIPEQGRAFALGGELDGQVIPPKLSMFDFESNTWNRWDIPKPDWRFRTYGSMVHIPFGDNGLLLLLGGADGHAGTWSGPWDGSRDGKYIDVYNLDAPSQNTEPGTWMSAVRANPDPKYGYPGYRKHPCSVAAVAPDMSSAQIFYFGGGREDHNIAEVENRYSGELWALSLPSFDWVMLHNFTGKGEQTNPGQREGMSCNMFGTKYMMMYGGRVQPEFSKNRETTGMYALDLSNVEWIQDWPGAEEARKQQYTIPKKVVDVIGGTENGGSTKKWSNPDVKMDVNLVQFFEAHFQKPRRYEDNPSSPSISPGAIAGIAVGAVGFFAIIGIAAFFFIRRRKTAASFEQEQPPPASDSPNGVYPRSELPCNSSPDTGLMSPAGYDTPQTPVPYDPHLKGYYQPDPLEAPNGQGTPAELPDPNSFVTLHELPGPR